MSVHGGPRNAAEAGLAIANAFSTSGIPYALGGALALGAHGVPRGTLDVDVNVFVSEHELPKVIAQLQSIGVEIEPTAAEARAHSAEAIAIFKLLFFRPKDLADLERLNAVQGAHLQRDYVRAWIVDMMGPDDDRVQAWDRIVAAGQAP